MRYGRLPLRRRLQQPMVLQQMEYPMMSKKDVVSVSETTEQIQRSRGLAAVLEELTEAGLTGRDIAAILAHTPSVAFMSATDTLRPILDKTFGLLSDTLKLRKYDARKVLRTCPGLLTGHGSKSAEEVVTLMSSLGVSAKSLGRDKVALPRLLSRSPAAIFRLTVFLSGRTVRMRPENVGALIRKPACADLLDAVAPVEPLNRMETSEIMADLDQSLSWPIMRTEHRHRLFHDVSVSTMPTEP